MQKSNWGNYVEKTKEKPPRPLLVEALQYVDNKNEALDVGSGALNDSKFLLRQGFKKVTAIDQTSIAEDIASTLPKERFKYKISKIEDINLPQESYDLINAQFSLPFLHPSIFEKTFSKLVVSLKKGGVFNGQFFGVNDEWNTNPEMTFLTRNKALQLMTGLQVLHFREKEEEGGTAAGNIKHWHIFDFIVKK